MTDVTKEELEAQLEALVEADGDPSAIAALIARIDAMGTEEPVVTAEALGIAPTVVTPAESQPELPIEKENNMASITLTKEQLGIGGEFQSALKELSLAEIRAALVEVQDTDDLEALVSSASKIGPDTRIHVEQRGEVRRAARGYAIFAAGGVSEDGEITSPDGHVHFVEDGICYQRTVTKQPDSFTGGVATIEKVTPCLGHLEYRNTGTPEKPKFVKTGREYTRCMHQWALMFAAGYFVTFSKSMYHDVIVTEIAQRVGDEQARDIAGKQIAEWRENASKRFETRKAFAMASAHARNVMGLPEGSRLPDVPEVLGYKLPDGRTMQEAILDLKGAAFVVEFTVPINGELSTQRVRAMSISEVRSRMAPAYALAKTQGGEINITAVKPAA